MPCSNTDTRRGLAGPVVATLLGAGVAAAALRGGSYDAVQRTEAFVLVWWVLLLAVGLGLLPRYRPPRLGTVAIVALLALAGWTALGMGWTDSDERTYAEAMRVLGFAGLLLLTFWAVGASDAILASALLTAVAVGVCVLAVVSRLAPDVVSSTLAETGYEQRRLAYPFDYWNALGAWAAMTVGLTLGWSAHAGARRLRAAALAGVPVAISVAYLTYSRTTAVCVVVGAAAVVGLSRHRWTSAVHAVVAAAGAALVIGSIRAQPELADGTGTTGASIVALTLAGVVALCVAAAYGLPADRLDALRVPRRAVRALVIAVSVAALVAAVVVGPAIADRAWDSFRTSGAVSGSDPVERLGNLGGPRYELYEVAVDGFRRHPIGGDGAGTFEFTWLQQRTSTLFVRDGHSLFLESLAEVGILGTLLVLLAVGALLAGVVGSSLRRTQPAAFGGAASGGAAAFLVWLVVASVDWMWESTAVTVAGLTAAAIAVSLGARRAGAVRARPRAGIAAALLLGLLVQLPLLVSALQVQASQEAFARGDVARALETATTAVEAAPWAATPLVQRALVLEAQGDLSAAVEDARAASRREPANWRTWIVLARIEAQRQRIRSALTAAERARRLNPRSPLWTPGTPLPEDEGR